MNGFRSAWYSPFPVNIWALHAPASSPSTCLSQAAATLCCAPCPIRAYAKPWLLSVGISGDSGVPCVHRVAWRGAGMGLLGRWGCRTCRNLLWVTSSPFPAMRPQPQPHCPGGCPTAELSLCPQSCHHSTAAHTLVLHVPRPVPSECPGRAPFLMLTTPINCRASFTLPVIFQVSQGQSIPCGVVASGGEESTVAVDC